MLCIPLAKPRYRHYKKPTSSITCPHPPTPTHPSAVPRLKPPPPPDTSSPPPAGPACPEQPLRSIIHAHFKHPEYIKHFNLKERFDRDDLDHLVEGRDQGLSEPEREHKLGTGHQELGGEALEERSRTLVLHHVLDDSETTLGVIEVSVLDASLDNIEGRGDKKRSGGTSNGSNEVLAPCSGVVVLDTEGLLGEGGTSEESKRTGSVTGSGPAPATVKPEPLVGNNLEETTAAESLGVGLALDLQDIEGEENDLTDSDDGTGGGGHDGFARGLAEGAVELVAVVRREVVTDERLATVLVDTLEDLCGDCFSSLYGFAVGAGVGRTL